MNNKYGVLILKSKLNEAGLIYYSIPRDALTSPLPLSLNPKVLYLVAFGYNLCLSMQN